MEKPLESLANSPYAQSKILFLSSSDIEEKQLRRKVAIPPRRICPGLPKRGVYPRRGGLLPLHHPLPQAENPAAEAAEHLPYHPVRV